MLDDNGKWIYRKHRPKSPPWPPLTRKKPKQFITLAEAARRCGHCRQTMALYMRKQSRWIIPDAVVGGVALFDPKRIDEMKESWPLYR